MGEFLHRLAEELRTREQYLEDHNDHPVFDRKDHDFRAEYEQLLHRLRSFTKKLEHETAKEGDMDLSFADEIEAEGKKLTVQVEAWRQTFN